MNSRIGENAYGAAECAETEQIIGRAHNLETVYPRSVIANQHEDEVDDEAEKDNGIGNIIDTLQIVHRFLLFVEMIELGRFLEYVSDYEDEQDPIDCRQFRAIYLAVVDGTDDQNDHEESVGNEIGRESDDGISVEKAKFFGETRQKNDEEHTQRYVPDCFSLRFRFSRVKTSLPDCLDVVLHQRTGNKLKRKYVIN